MSVADINILSIIPQRPPFVMVNRLLSADDQSVCAELVVADNNIFVKNNMLIEAGVIEHIAQTCAAGMGYVGVYRHKSTVKIGFLSAIRNLTILRLPKVGEILSTRISIVEHVMEMILIKADVKIKDETIAEGEMKIFVTDIDNEKDI